jgi:hypothetical protein
MFLLLKDGVLFRRIGTDSEKHDILFLKFIDSIPESLRFQRSSRSAGAEIKPENNLFPQIIFQIPHRPGFIRQKEVRGSRTFL